MRGISRSSVITSGSKSEDLVTRCVGIARGADDLYLGIAGECVADGAARQGRIVNDQHADGP